MLRSGLPENVTDDEPLARFLTSDSQFNRALAKPSAFMPGPADEKTSVFRQGAEPLTALWDLGDREIGAQRRVRAAAMLTAGHVRRAALEVEASEPPPRHADIVGWPRAEADPDATRAQRRERALLLAQAAVLVLR